MEIENTPNEYLINSEDSIPKNKKFDVQSYILYSENNVPANFLNSKNNAQREQSPIIIVDKNGYCVFICFFILIFAIFNFAIIFKKYFDNYKTFYIILAIIFIFFSFLILMICKKN
jgi:hypothetical protein